MEDILLFQRYKPTKKVGKYSLEVEPISNDNSLLFKKAEYYYSPDYAFKDRGEYGEYGWFMERLRAWKDKEKIINAFKSVFGRNPTDAEILQVATAYEWNKGKLGVRLKNKRFVVWLQQAINSIIGNKVKVDGIFGYQTVAGIMKVQKAKGLKANGFLDTITLEVLKGAKQATNLTLAKEDLFSSGTNKKFWLYLLGGIVVAGVVAYFLLKKE